MYEMLYEQMGSYKWLGGLEIEGEKPVLVYSDVDRQFSVGRKGQNHSRPSGSLFLNHEGKWVPYWSAVLCVDSNVVIEFARQFGAKNTPIPYDEIDQEEE